MPPQFSIDLPREDGNTLDPVEQVDIEVVELFCGAPNERSMNQKQRAIADLREGKTTRYKGHGNSMHPRIPSGATVVLEPVELADIEVGDAVFCRVRRNVFVHRVSALKGGIENREVQISNLRGHVNGWTTAVYGRVIHVEKP